MNYWKRFELMLRLAATWNWMHTRYIHERDLIPEEFACHDDAFFEGLDAHFYKGYTRRAIRLLHPTQPLPLP